MAIEWILVLWISGYSTGDVPTTLPKSFTTMTACENVGKDWVAEQVPGGNRRHKFACLRIEGKKP